MTLSQFLPVKQIIVSCALLAKQAYSGVEHSPLCHGGATSTSDGISLVERNNRQSCTGNYSGGKNRRQSSTHMFCTASCEMETEQLATPRHNGEEVGEINRIPCFEIIVKYCLSYCLSIWVVLYFRCIKKQC